MAQVVHRTIVHCRSPRAALWTLAADTEKLNRFIGSSALEVRPIENGRPTAARFLLKAQVGPTKEEYEEEPYEWIEHRFFSLRRIFRGSLVAWLTTRYEFDDDDPPDGGSRVTVELVLQPRFFFAWPIVWFFSRRDYVRVVEYIGACDTQLAEQKALELEAVPADRAAAEKAAAVLRKRHDPVLVDQLRDFLCSSSDVDVGRVRPFELADQWKRGRHEVLRLCLDGVSAGLTELNWSLICPSCRGPTAEKLPSLGDLDSTSHCQFCDIAFDIELDRAVEATFSPHRAVRQLDLKPYCIGGPRLKPHVVSQAVTGPGRIVILGAAEESGRYRLFLQGGATAVVDIGGSAPSKAEVQVQDGRFSPPQLEVEKGGTISVSATSLGHVKLEKTTWAFNAATAVVVSSLPEFRAQFGGAALRPGLVLKVGRVAIFFSDLVGSTALYSRVGDAAAFGIVTDCLEYGREVVERNGGTVVKTMGDAIMAVFTDPSQAVTAAVQTASGWPALQKAKPGVAQLEVKLGVTAGPCTIVTANGVLDYFGQTVNTASRVQHLAGARELVVPAELIEASGVPAGARLVERFEAKVKGIDQPLGLVRLTAEV